MQACPITYHHTRSLTLFTQDPFLFFPVFSFTKKEEKYFFDVVIQSYALFYILTHFYTISFFDPLKSFFLVVYCTWYIIRIITPMFSPPMLCVSAFWAIFWKAFAWKEKKEKACCDIYVSYSSSKYVFIMT